MAVIATGSVAFDHILTFRGRIAEHLIPEKAHVINLSFLVDRVERRRGGIAANYAYTLSLLGHPAAILATAGEDAADYKHWLEARGIDCSGLVLLEGEQTATGYTTTDLDDNQITGYFGGAMLKAGSIGLAATAASADAVIVGPNAPDAMQRLVAECRQRRIPWVWDPAHQLPRMAPAEILEGCRGAWIVIGNDYELELIHQRTGRDSRGLLDLAEMVVTTFGREGSRIDTREGHVTAQAAPASPELDPVGAGDAYRGGLVYGLLSGRSLAEAARIASVAAAYVVEHRGTIEHTYLPAEFEARYRRAYGIDLDLRARSRDPIIQLPNRIPGYASAKAAPRRPRRTAR